MEIDIEMPSRDCSNVPLDDQMRSLEISEEMEFESKEEAFEFYKVYANSIGFNIVVKASRRSRMSGKFIDAKFVCTRYGSKKTEEGEGLDTTRVKKRGRINRSMLKCDCKACLHVKRREDGRWVVRSLVKEHNHEVSSGQGKSVRDLSVVKKLEKQNGGTVKEMKSKKLVGLENGDFERLLEFFTEMQIENPFFFYSFDLSEEMSLRNVFWVDAKGRLDYSCFCDVVSIDTTSIKNEYKLPLVAFTGVNNHGQLLLLGCGLLFKDECKSGFVWLFRAWLKAMHGCYPGVILTKHDQTLKEAVSEVFPSSKHCFYMWDTLGQMPEKLGHVIREEKSLMDEINEAIYGSCESDEFEKKWWEVVDRFQKGDNAWLQSLYDDREYWVPVYMKDVSLAGMCTDQRSDFDKYIHRKTTLKVFLDQYKSMIQERYEEEEKAEMETLYKQPGLKSPSPFGKQMAEVYTREMFKKFQVEVLGGVACHPKKESEEDEVNKNTYRVQDYEQNRAFVVVLNCDSSEVVCSCRMFELKGFLCRHAMIVLQMSGELSIPSQYVLKRWTKDARSRDVVVSDQIDVDSTKAQRYMDLCIRSLKLSEEASLSEERYKAVISVLDKAFSTCEDSGNVIHNVEESESISAQDPSGNEEQNNIFDENAAGCSGQVSGNEEHSLHEVWKATALEEQRNRFSILDDYLTAQQISHEMGQINSMASSNRNAYQNIHSLAQSITQQRLYGTASCSLNQEQLSFRPEAMYERLQDMEQSSFRDHPQQHCDSSKFQQSNRNFSD